MNEKMKAFDDVYQQYCRDEFGDDGTVEEAQGLPCYGLLYTTIPDDKADVEVQYVAGSGWVTIWLDNWFLNVPMSIEEVTELVAGGFDWIYGWAVDKMVDAGVLIEKDDGDYDVVHTSKIKSAKVE